MIYINEKLLSGLGIDWNGILSVIENATCLIEKRDVSQPVKPYLRFNNCANRIIAMPAYVGGGIHTAGIKWIASFPGNKERAMRLAHSVTILNDAETGVPTAIINTPLLSGIRTAAVSGFVLRKYLESNPRQRLRCGIVGFGPIGRLHAEMLQSCFGESIGDFFIYDNSLPRKELLRHQELGHKITVCSGWEEVYEKSDLFITCTVAKERYVNRVPKNGSLYFNVSLRDFHPQFLMSVDVNLVDDWEEVCRENTDIEAAHRICGLNENNVLGIVDILHGENLCSLRDRSFMFNPMGMAVFDIAVARYYLDLAIQEKMLVNLED